MSKMFSEGSLGIMIASMTVDLSYDYKRVKENLSLATRKEQKLRGRSECFDEYMTHDERCELSG